MNRKSSFAEIANGDWQLVQSSDDWLFIIDGNGNIIADIADQVKNTDRERIGKLMACAEKLQEAAQRLCDEYSDYSTIHHGPAADLLDDAIYDEYEALAMALQSIKSCPIAKCHIPYQFVR